ncbi:MAG: exonuclease [Bdellovibrionales bacterium CG10_big_fil_rev_8_21_14_0_10_45_34]|nr:MAG: exonuclease [Bdellovibrionales bacterium CG10_big_fil_rev_8_21_14_0_10_45_34]
MEQILSAGLKNLEIVSFDTETSGAFPVGNDIVELAAVKWKNGEIIGEFQSLIKPREPMGDFIISIHRITNEMVSDAPTMETVLPSFLSFIGEAVLVAHHAPFDLGFLAYDIERLGYRLPQNRVLCSSLLSRTLISGAPNHRLQTLVEFLNLHKGDAHRALDDSKACLGLLLECFSRLSHDCTLEKVMELMGKDLSWRRYSLEYYRKSEHWFSSLIDSINQKSTFRFLYGGKTYPEEKIKICQGVVRNPDGDFIACVDPQPDPTARPKRYYLSRIRGV